MTTEEEHTQTHTHTPLFQSHAYIYLWFVFCKGYSSDQLELGIIVTFPAAEPVAARVLHVGEHT